MVRSQLLLAVQRAGVVLSALALCACGPAPAPAGPDAAAVQAQLLKVCAAVKPRGGSCGAPRRDDGAATAMSRDVSAGQGLDEPREALPVKPVDVWGRNVQISVGGDGLRLQSAGADGEFGSGDDVVQVCPTD
jgi:uncharacterized low-complexity protein